MFLKTNLLLSVRRLFSFLIILVVEFESLMYILGTLDHEIFDFLFFLFFLFLIKEGEEE